MDTVAMVRRSSCVHVCLGCAIRENHTISMRCGSRHKQRAVRAAHEVTRIAYCCVCIQIHDIYLPILTIDQIYFGMGPVFCPCTCVRRSTVRSSDVGRSDSVAARDKIVINFATDLPRWLRRCGVQHAYLADAVQEALKEALASLNVDPQLDEANAHEQCQRIMWKVAVQARRQLMTENACHTSFESAEAATPRDEEALIETREILLEALENLDEPTRALIYAHDIEGRTNGEIAAALKLKEDAVEKRVVSAKKRLRAEIEHLERGRIRKHRHEGLLLLGLGFDPFDRAVFGAMYDAMGKAPTLVVKPRLEVPRLQNLLKPNLPTTALVGALALTPSSSPSPAPSPLTEAEAEAGETNVQQVKHVSSAEVPEATVLSAYSLPTTFFVLGSSVNSVPSKESKPSILPASTHQIGSNAGDSSSKTGSSRHDKPAPFVDIPSLYDDK